MTFKSEFYINKINEYEREVGVEIGVRDAFSSNEVISRTTIKKLYGIDIADSGNGRKLEEETEGRYTFIQGKSPDMSDMFNESIGMALNIEEGVPEDLVGKFLVEDYGSFEKGTKITDQNAPLLAAYGTVKGNNQGEAYGWWIASLIFMYAWFGLYFLCAHRLFKRNKVPRKDYFKLQIINVSIVIILLRMGFGISSSEYHFILTRFQYLFGGM